MSESSDSHHLLGTVAQAVELLRRAGARGAALPGTGRWTAIVTHPRDGGLLVPANEGLLLSYRYAADFGCWVQLFEGSDMVGEISQDWQRGTGSFDVAPWLRARACDAAAAEAIADAVAPPVEPDARAYAVAKALGLSRYAWLSSTDYCIPEQLEGHGDVRWVPERPDEEDPGAALLDAMASGLGPFGPRTEKGRALVAEIRDGMPKRKH